MAKAQPIVTVYDQPMWESLEALEFKLQCCASCNAFRYPPSPNCPECLSLEATWEAVSGVGTILSWVVFHRTYFEDYPAPYNCIAVQLAEGPILVSNLTGSEPEGTWIGCQVAINYRDHDGRIQHSFSLANGAHKQGVEND